FQFIPFFTHSATHLIFVKFQVMLIVGILMRWVILLRILAWIFRNRKTLIKKIYRKDDWEVAKKKVHYIEFPPRSMWEVFRSISATKKIIPKIKDPILVMQSGSDKIILPKSAEYLHANVGSKVKELVFFADSYHVFTVDKHAEKAHKIMGEFISRL
ncbi:MAG TPA: alpha/beta hydrolase, partial [Candidatus Paceibacterota bacterium]